MPNVKLLSVLAAVLVALAAALWAGGVFDPPAGSPESADGRTGAPGSASAELPDAAIAEAARAVDEAGARAEFDGAVVRTGVRGRLVDAETRAPLGGVEVLAMRRPPGFERLLTRFRTTLFEGKGFWAEAVPAPEILASTTTGPDGSFELLGLSEGVVFLDGRADFTFVRTPQRVRLARGEVREGVELVGTASGRVRGIVYDGEGLPASGVAVNVRPGLNAFLGQITERQYRWLESVTDANGEFDIPGVPEGHGYTLSAAGPLIALAEEHGIDVAVGEVTNVVVYGRAGATIEGRVLDIDGTPCSGANVAMVYLDVSRVLFSADGRNEPITTDADGHFRLDRVAAGRVAFVAAADGRAGSSIEELAVVDGGVYDELELALRGGHEFGGLVVDQDGRPVAGARVEIRPMERPDGPDVLKMLLKIRQVEVETGLDGRFVTEGVSARRVFMQVSKPGYVTEIRFAHDTEEEGDVRIELARGVTVRGRVTRPDGQPVSRFRVDARSRTPRPAGEEAGDGPGGDDAAVDGTSSATESGWGQRGGRGRWNRGGSMRLAEGQRMGDRGFDGSWREFSDQDGRFEITGVPPGEVRVRVRAEGHRDPESRTVTLAAGETSDDLEFVAELGAVARGVVVDAIDGVPVADAEVTAYRDRGRRGGMFRMNFDRQDMDFLGMASSNTARTDAKGSFEIAGLSEGDYRFTARHPDRAKASVKDVHVEADVPTEGIVIEIDTGGAIEGTVTGRVGMPIGDSLIVAVSVQAGTFKSASTDRQGLYRIDGLPAGQYVVFKSKIGARAMNLGYDLLSNMRLKTVRVRKNEVTRFDIQDEEDNTVRVWGVVRDGGEPVAQGMVTALSTDRDGIFGMGLRAQPTDADGRYELIGLKPGDYFFQVSRFRQRPQQASLSVEVPEGVTELRVDLELPQSSIEGRVVDTRGAPVVGVMVAAGVEEGGLDEAPGLLGIIMKNGVAQDRTDAEGRFKLDKMAAGVYRLSASGRNGRRANRKYGEAVLEGVAIDGNLAVQGLVLTLPLAGKITGTVVDGSGNPVPGAEIHYEREDGPASTQDATEELVDLLGVQLRPETSDSEGRFELTGLTPGTYLVRADADGLAPGVERDVYIAEEGEVEVEVQVLRGATVRVRARNVDGSKIPFASITVLDGDGKKLASKVSVMSVFRGLMGRKQEKADTGWYEVGNIPPDTYTVVITEEGKPEVRVTREIRDGETVEWDIDLSVELENAGRARK